MQNADSGRVLEYLFVAYLNEKFVNSSDNDMKVLHDIRYYLVLFIALFFYIRLSFTLIYRNPGKGAS